MDYTLLYAIHKYVVMAFVLHYVVKTALLFASKNGLQTYTKITKVPEMILSVAFLGTGIGMLVQQAEIKPLIFVKLAAVVASIPLAVIGFKKEKKVLAVLSLVLLFVAYGMAEMLKKKVSKAEISSEVVIDPTNASYNIEKHGQALYLANCVICHGEKGDAGIQGAKDLTLSVLPEQEILTLLMKGKNSMPSYKHLTENEHKALVSFVSTMKK